MFTIFILFASLAQADEMSCKEQLIALIDRAEIIVKTEVMNKDCRSGAMEGNTLKKRWPDCKDESLDQVKGKMSPIGVDARKICDSKCKVEGQQSQCRGIVSKLNLIINGLNGTRTRINNEIIDKASLIVEEEKLTLPVTTEI